MNKDYEILTTTIHESAIPVFAMLWLVVTSAFPIFHLPLFIHTDTACFGLYGAARIMTHDNDDGSKRGKAEESKKELTATFLPYFPLQDSLNTSCTLPRQASVSPLFPF